MVGGRMNELGLHQSFLHELKVKRPAGVEQKGESHGMHLTYASANREKKLPLKPRAETSEAQKWSCENVVKNERRLSDRKVLRYLFPELERYSRKKTNFWGRWVSKNRHSFAPAQQ